MILTGKIKLIEFSVKPGWATIILSKNRKGKPILIPVFFPLDKFGDSINSGILSLGISIDVNFFISARKNGEYWNTFLIASSWRKYSRGQIRIREIVSKSTGEIFTRKNEF